MFNNRKVLDVHAHVSAPWSLYAPILMMLGANTPMPQFMLGSGSLSRGSRMVNFDESGMQNTVAGHVSAMDERSIDVQIIGPRPFLQFGWMQPHLMGVWAELNNNIIAKQCEMYPDRFLGAAILPQQADAPDSSHMIPELNRCVDELGFVAAYISPDPDGRRTSPGVHEPYWDDLYARAVELDIPLILHGTTNHDRRASAIPHNYQLNFVTEQYLAKEFLIRGRLFDRFPELRVCVCHCGGALDRFLGTDEVHIGQQDLTNNLFYDTCAYDIDFLTAAIRQKGAKSMCFGAEVPGSGQAIRPDTGRPSDDLIPIIGGFGWLTDDEKDAILHDNPLRFCKAFASKL